MIPLRNKNHWLRWQIVVLFMLASLAGIVSIVSRHSQPIAQGAVLAPSAGYQVTLPLVMRTDQFSLNQPIWAATGTTQPHEVVLFRYSFNLDQPLLNVELQLFADTRYQAWLDGNPVGRGPARFSQTYREVDVYQNENLAPGEHVLAVLVQWSPDDRRSESVRPLLQGGLQGSLDDGSRLVLRTGSGWKALLSPAWRGDAALIHQWGLIGYSELLDLNQLPDGWFRPGFSDTDWPQARVVDPYQPVWTLNTTTQLSPMASELLAVPELDEALFSIHYNRRSIAFPISEPVTATLLDSGRLLSGRALVEIPAGTPSPYTLPFQVDTTTPFRIETLGPGAPPADTLILLDGSPLPWQPAGTSRPDVYFSEPELMPGIHTLLFNLPPEGLTLALSTANLSSLDLPFQQGNHAGRRLLLAEPVSQPGIVVTGAGGISSLEFTQLPAYAVLDLGRVTHGRLVAQVSGPAGAVIDIGWDERMLEGTTRPLPYPGSLYPQWNQTDSWVLDGTSRELTTIDARSGRYILIAVWGSGPVLLDNLVIYSEHYPVTRTGNFQSSDPLLDLIWQIGVDSVQLNMVDAYMDPWRERGQWWGDSYIDDQVNQVAFGDAELLRRGLVLMDNAFPGTLAPGCAPHNNNLHMLDYAMLWVHSLSDHTRRTGDIALLQATYPTLVEFIQHLESFENPTSGLLDLPLSSWAETAYIDTLGYASRPGQSAALNAMYYATLLKAAELAAQVGDLAQHELWQSQAGAVKNSLNTWLYLPEQGRYITTIYDGVAYPPTLYAQAWPLAYGLVPALERERVATALLELVSSDPADPNVGIYGFYWILEGLGQAGYYDQAISLIKSYYGRLIDLGATTWWESFQSNLYYSGALSHGWGSSPTWFLTTYILGARQVAPDEWRFQPAFTALEQVSGSLPLPQGELQAAWHTNGCTSGAGTKFITLELEVPAGTHGQVVLPGDLAWQSLSINGSLIALDRFPPAAYSTEFAIPLEAGSHTIEIGNACEALP